MLFGSGGESELVLFVAIRDVIKSVGVVPQDSRARSQVDLLLIGCPCSVIIYSVLDQAHLLSIRTSSPIGCILVPHPVHSPANFTISPQRSLAICSGAQKLYTIQLDESSWENSELTSERSTSGSTISCMTRVDLGRLDFLLAGSSNETGGGGGGAISLYQLNLSDKDGDDNNNTNNIRACELRIDESAPVSCLCAIPTAPPARPQSSAASADKDADGESTLPSLSQLSAVEQPSGGGSNTYNEDEDEQEDNQPQRNYFAYGLQNGLLGVHRLVAVEQTAEGVESARPSIGHERLWRHKCKCTPTSIGLFDLNGDGLDELVIGFASGRLELRSPLTGQLLGATRLAGGSGGGNNNSNPQQQSSADKAQPSSLAVGLAQIQLMGSRWLLGCTGRGTIIGFRPLASKSHQPLQDVWSRQLAESWHRHQSAAFVDKIDPLLASKTIAIEQQLDYNSRMSVLHTAVDSSVSPTMESGISSSSGSTTLAAGGGPTSRISGSIEARQSHDLLQKINSLYAHQIDLRQRVSRALVGSASAASKNCPPSAGAATCLRPVGGWRAQNGSSSASAGSNSNSSSIRHRWYLDLAKVSITLLFALQRLVGRRLWLANKEQPN